MGILGKIFGARGRVTINGQSYTGQNISIVNHKVIIDGVEQGGKDVYGDVKIVIEGGCDSLESSAGDVTVNGDVKGDVSTQAGDVSISGAVGGNVSTSAGDVTCGNVGGSVKTMAGDISHRK